MTYPDDWSIDDTPHSIRVMLALGHLRPLPRDPRYRRMLKWPKPLASHRRAMRFLERARLKLYDVCRLFEDSATLASGFNELYEIAVVIYTTAPLVDPAYQQIDIGDFARRAEQHFLAWPINARCVPFVDVEGIVWDTAEILWPELRIVERADDTDIFRRAVGPEVTAFYLDSLCKLAEIPIATIDYAMHASGEVLLRPEMPGAMPG